MRDVRNFGATGDGTTKDTRAIQRALDAGGIAYLPPGEYLSGTLYLHSGGGLELSPGAVLRGSPDPADYDENPCPHNRVFSSEMVSGAHLVVACEVHDLNLLLDDEAHRLLRVVIHALDPEGDRVIAGCKSRYVNGIDVESVCEFSC